MDTQTQIDRLIELAIVQRSELKQLVSELPQLREYLGAEIERTFEEAEPQIRTELEEFCRARATDEHAKTGAALAAKVEELSKQLEVTTAAKYSVLMAERAENVNLLAKAEARIEDAASMLSHAVKEIVTDELSRFPRAGEIDQLRKEFAEPRGLNPRGRWMPDETYQRLDLVTINGDSFVSNIDGNRERPSRTAGDWTLSAARGNGGGGGGVTTMTDLVPVPTDGQLLIGNGSAFVNATLTAGTGISISNGPGSITINATDGNITLDDGTAAAPSLNFTSDTNTGLYRPAADTVGIVGGGHEILRLTDVANATDYLEIKGAIGVATPVHVIASGPSASIGMHLQPKGSGLLTISDGTDANKGIRFRSSSSAASAITLLDAVSTAGRVITLPDATDTLVGKATTDTLTNKTLTTPTIGTITAPTSTDLTLSGGSSGASLVLGQGSNGAATLTFGTGGTGKLALVKSGAGPNVEIANLGGSTHIKETGGTAIYYSAFNHIFYNSAVTTELFRATSTGNLLIGTTTDTTRLTVKPGSNTYQLSLLQSNTDAAGWGMWADTSGNLNITRYASSAFATPDLVFSSAGNLTLGAGRTFSAPVIAVTDTTASTGVGTGALQVAGGIYAGAASVFGSTLAIGPTAPANLLHVSTSSGSADFKLARVSSTNQYMEFGIDSTSSYGGAIWVGGTKAARFDPNGGVGIGTGSQPTANGLLVGGAATFGGAVTVSGTRLDVKGGATAASAGYLTADALAGGLAVVGIGTSTNVRIIATNSGATNTDAALFSSTGTTLYGAAITASTTLSGAGAIPITTSLVKFTSTGGAQALTLADGADGQRLTIVHDVKGTLGTGVLTPTTKTGFTTVTFTNAGDTVSLVYVTTRGWMVTGSYLATIA
jgi:hypothetical protein